MKFNSLKKLLSATLVGAMAVGLVACGSSNTASAPAASTNNTATQATTAEPAAPAEPVHVTWSVIDLNAGENNVGDHAEEIFQQIKDYTGADIELIWYANDALSEKNSLALADPGSMPMVMSWGGTMTGDIVSAAKNGAFVDLSQYIYDSAKYPNLSQLPANIAANLTINGQLIALPRTRVVGRYGLSYRTDWAEKLGVTLGANATPDDVYKMIEAFTTGDPDGNGKNDTIGMEMCTYTGPFDIIQTWFGCGNGWMEIDGQLKPVWESEHYFEAADYIKKIYENGFMPKDWVSIPTDTWSNGCKVGTNGVYIDVLDSGKRIWQYFEADETKTASVVNPDETASMTLYGAVNGHTLATAGYNGFFTVSATTCDTPEKIEAVLTMMDKLCDKEMLILTQYGLEGINWQINADGKLEDIDADGKDEAQAKLAANYKGLNQLLTFLPTTEIATERVNAATNKFNDAQNEAYATALKYAEINPALSYLVNSDTYSAQGADLDSQVTAARTQYICGEIDMDAFKAVIEQVKNGGYNDIISEVNAQR